MNKIIAISREYGSGGRYVAMQLAKNLDIPLYDKEILTIAAQESGISKEFFEEYDEKPTRSYLFSLMASLPGRSNIMDGTTSLPLNHKVFLAQFEAIKEVVKKGPCIIVGRCADWVLQEDPRLLKVFIQAPMEVKKERVVKYYGVKAEKAEDTIKKTDKQRANYYEYYTSNKWGKRQGFDLCVNAGLLGIENTVKLIEEFIHLA